MPSLGLSLSIRDTIGTGAVVVVTGALLLEDGSYLLLEDGSQLLLE